jgi:hypothetical protein
MARRIPTGVHELQTGSSMFALKTRRTSQNHVKLPLRMKVDYLSNWPEFGRISVHISPMMRGRSADLQTEIWEHLNNSVVFERSSCSTCRFPLAVSSNLARVVEDMEAVVGKGQGKGQGGSE